MIVQLGGGLHRFTADLFSPLSAGKAAAAYIRDRDWETVFIVASPDNVMTPIAGYLDRSFYYPEIQGMGSFTRWRDRVPVDRDEVLRQVEEILRKNSAEVDRLLLIVNPEFSWSELQLGDALAVGNLTIEAERRFERSWVGDERYYLYWVSLSPQIESRGDH